MTDRNARLLPTIDHAGMLEDLTNTPGFLMPDHKLGQPQIGHYTCSFCGVGDSCIMVPKVGVDSTTTDADLIPGAGRLLVEMHGESLEMEATLYADGRLNVLTGIALTEPGGVMQGEFKTKSGSSPISAREVDRETDNGDRLISQSFSTYRRTVSTSKTIIRKMVPTTGCVKLSLSMMRQRPAFPVHVAPSLLEGDDRRTITYDQAIAKFADMLLAHRNGKGRTLIYASGQIDYFTVFAMQEVFRLLGVRNLTGNAEHCLNAGAVHNEILTGQEGPFLTVAQSLGGENRFYLMNGWNGFITHPPAFRQIMKQDPLDAYIVEIMETESAKALIKKLGDERVLLIKPRSDPHFALAVANEILSVYPDLIETRFIEYFSDEETYEGFVELASSDRFTPERVAGRIAPEPECVERLIKGIKMIAFKLTRPDVVPINIPSVGLSQTSGVVAHCLWGCVLAMLGKFGLNTDGSTAGGTLRLPGQINAETEVQGLSNKYFMGRIPIAQYAEAAQRMGLPEDAYQQVIDETPRAALDYSDPTTDMPELFVCFGTSFESNMIGRSRWIEKLKNSGTSLVVIDPIPDPFTIENAELILPSPPHPATTKLYQNGEWKLALSTPQKKAPSETRSDATIIYDVMAEIIRQLETDPAVAADHPDLMRHIDSGYLHTRFCPPAESTSDTPPSNGQRGAAGLTRITGEVSRPELWNRIQDYMAGGCGPLYCRPEYADGRPISWSDLIDKGSIIYGGVGTHRFRIDYDQPDLQPFADIYRQPRKFRFFVPTEDDLEIPEGLILNSGRSTLSDDFSRIRFASSTFNSGKATPTVLMPDENPLYVSKKVAESNHLKTGDRARVTGRQSGDSIVLPVIVTNRIKGETVYVSFHKSRAEIEDGVYVNTVTSNRERCAYCAQTRVKATPISLERVAAQQSVGTSLGRGTNVLPMDTTSIDPRLDLPVWQGQGTPLYVTDIIQETDDVYTFRLQGHPLCRFVYWPGQFCTLVLNIDGKKVVRSYSISSPPTRPFVLEITVKRVPGGLVSNWLPDNLKVGDRIEIAGPKGKFTLVPGKIPPKILFIAAGSGVTALLSMARWLCDVSANVDIKFFNSVRSAKDIIFRKEIELLTSRYKIFSPAIVTTTRGKGDDWAGMSGRISRPMMELLAPDLHDRHIFMCGPPGFMAAVKGILQELDFNLANLHSESFGGVRTSVAKKSGSQAADNAGADASAMAPFVGGATGTEAPAPSAGDTTVVFAKSGISVKTDGQKPLLDLAEENDVDLDYGCRMGACGECKCQLLTGEVDMDESADLDPEEREQGYILTCVATPKTNCTLNA